MYICLSEVGSHFESHVVNVESFVATEECPNRNGTECQTVCFVETGNGRHYVQIPDVFEVVVSH